MLINSSLIYIHIASYNYKIIPKFSSDGYKIQRDKI